jgi:hypothetical protein
MGNLFIFRDTLNLPGQAASEFYWRGINRIYGRNPNDAEEEDLFVAPSSSTRRPTSFTFNSAIST